jgi:DNA replication protein DnaC
MAELDIAAANQRLLEKRAALNQTANLGQRIENTDFQAIADRCKEKAKDCGRVYIVPEEKIYSNKPVEESWFGKYDGVSRLYKDCSFETFQGNDKLKSDLKGISVTDQSIVLRGPTGCGKTHLAISTIKERFNKSLRSNSVFITVPDLLLKIRTSFNGGAESEEEIIRQFSDIETLVLDDLGAEKTSEYSITTLYVILDRRIRECLKTIITTNLLQSEIEATFGARIASRMSAMENIKINMPDYRKKRG